MLEQEARRIRDCIGRLESGGPSLCLNLGSSTKYFRTVTQPYIESEIIRPLEDGGCKVVHCDLKHAIGVDEVGDLLDEDVQIRLASYQPDLVICSNMLEHIADPVSFLTACGKILAPGGSLLITVPSSFPYHPDPIDTMFRPSSAELCSLLPHWTVLASEDISAGNLRQEFIASGTPLKSLLRLVVRSLLPIYKSAEWWPAAHRLFWLFRDYRVALVLLRKPE